MEINKYVSQVKGHALVLGGSGEIGTEIVRALVAHGATAVSFTYNSKPERAMALKAELETRGVKVFVDKVDQLDHDGFKSFLNQAVAVTGEEITVAVNAIGWSPNTPIEEQTLDEHRKVMDINVHGPFFTTRSILERMKSKAVKGSVVIITSTNGVNSNSPISSHYDASKAALVPHIRNFAMHYASAELRVNGVAPGWINTSMNATLPQDERKKEESRIWAGRFAEAHEVAVVVATIAGSGGSYVSGTNIMVDGGYQ